MILAQDRNIKGNNRVATEAYFAIVLLTYPGTDFAKYNAWAFLEANASLM